jgi:aminoglycoside phosphotransferase (APT) family kinase protein
MTAVRPQAYLAAEGLVLYPGVVGTPLAAYLRRPGHLAAHHLRAAGAGLRALHRAPAALASQVAPHDFAAELAATARASEHVPALLPAAGARIARLLDRARALHARLPPEGPTFAHGDLKADHLWVTPAGPVLLDFDSCCLADPALDVGKLLADLRCWSTAYGQPGLERAQEQFLEGYAPAQPARDACLARARLYEAVLLLKMTVRRVRLFDPDWAPRTARLLGCAEAALAAPEAMLASPLGRGR